MKRKKRRQARAKTKPSFVCRIEPLEERLLLFATDLGGPWDTSALTWSIDNLYDGDIRDSTGAALSNYQIHDSVVEGLSVWTAVSPLTLRQVQDSGPSPSDDHYRAGTHPDIRIGHHFIDGVPTDPNADDDIAHACTPDESSGFPLYLRGLAGDIHLDNGNRFDNPDSGSEVNLGQLIAHEAGHAFGLLHEKTDPAIMNQGRNGDTLGGVHWTSNGTGFILQDDIDGIQTLYGSGLGYVLTSGDWLHVSGTTGDNTIQVDYNSDWHAICVSSTGYGSFAIDADDVTGIEIHARQGDDTIKISSLPDGVEAFVYGGADNDTINVGGADFDTNIRANVLVYGGSGNDTLYFRDGDDLRDDNITRVYTTFVTKNTVANNATLSWEISELEKLIVVGSDQDGIFELDGSADGSLDVEIRGNGGQDTFNLLDVDDGLDVTIKGGDENDTFNVGFGTRADYDFYVRGNLTLQGNSGHDIMTIDDANDHGTDDYRLDKDNFEKPGTGGAVLTYQGMEAIDIRANDYGNSIAIEAIDDDVQNLKVDAGGGTDTLVFDDQRDPGEDEYTLVPEHLSSTGDAYLRKVGVTGASRTYSYTGFEGVELLANGDANTITVEGTDSGVPVVLKGNGGGDEFRIGEGDLDNLKATVDVQGGSGADKLFVEDQSSVLTAPGYVDDSYHVTTSEVVKVQVGFDPTITYSSVSQLWLQANGDDSSINIPSTSAVTDVLVIGNGGSDHFHVARDTQKLGDIRGWLMLYGGSSSGTTDKLTVYDANANTTVEHTYDIDGDTIDRTNSMSINFVEFEEVALYGSGADDTLNVGDPAGTPISDQFLIDAGGGTDTVNVGGGNVLSSIDDSDLVSVVGGEGHDTVQLDDQDAKTAGVYTVTSTTLEKYVSASYDGFEEIYLLTGTMNVVGSYIAVDSTAAGATLDIVYQGNGSTRVTLGSGDLLSDLGGDVSLSRTRVGMAPDLTLDDTTGSIDTYVIDGSANPMTIDLDAGSLTVTADFDDLTLNANDNANTIELSDATWLDRVTLNGNDGEDDFHVNTDVSGGSPYIYIDGGAPTTSPGDDLFVSGTTGTYQADSATTGSGTVTGTGGLTLDFVNFEPLYATGYTTFTLITPNSDDVITLEHDRISGTSNGVAFEPLVFSDVTNVVLDTDTNNGAVNRDKLTIDDDGSISDYTLDTSSVLLTTDSGSTLTIEIDPVDTLVINASDDRNSIDVSDHSVLSEIELNGNGGEDVFLVAAENATTVDISIEGGDPTTDPGDTLEVYGTGSESITNTPDPSDSGVGWVTNPDGLYIHYVGLETIARQLASVVERHVFYSNSYFDGDPSEGRDDDNAIATDKQALRLPGQTATMVNYTSFSRGINGIMVDIANLADARGLSNVDFEFHVSNRHNSPTDNTHDPFTWAMAPTPTISVREDAGTNSSDRVTLIWSDQAVHNQWLQVTVKANATTGLATDDVFYYGNAIGECGDAPGFTFVDGTDFAGTRDNTHDSDDRAPIDDRFDYNRDSLVDETDLAIARDNHANFLTCLTLFTAPPLVGSASSSPCRSLPSPTVQLSEVSPVADHELGASVVVSGPDRPTHALVDRSYLRPTTRQPADLPRQQTEDFDPETVFAILQNLETDGSEFASDSASQTTGDRWLNAVDDFFENDDSDLFTW